MRVARMAVPLLSDGLGAVIVRAATMKHILITGFVSMLTASILAADNDGAKDAKAAARGLGQQKNYSWVSTSRSEAGSPSWRQGPINGQTEKDGYTYIKFDIGDNTIEAAWKGPKSAVTIESVWTGADELTGDQAWIAAALKAYRPPAREAEQLAEGATQLAKQADGTLSGALKDETVKELLLMGRRSDTPPKDVKGSVKFWLKDGTLPKYEYNLQGKIQGRDGQELDLNRTTTVEIKNLGSTKVQLPEEAKKKLL